MEGNNTGLAANNTGNCTYGGTDENDRFGEPMRWVGLYVAAASAVCAAAYATDVIRSFRWRKVWVSPKFFVLNAAVLTILGIAVKIPNDINGTMPGLFDQLAKPSGILLICLAMSHALSSLGVMDNRELLSNMVALGILVVSTAANIWFQIHTGLITRYDYIDKVGTIVMLLMFLILASHSLSVASIKQHLEKQYQSKHKEILRGVGDHQVPSREELDVYVPMYWLMALTSSPDFVLMTCGVSAACVLLYSALFGVFVYSLLSSIRLHEKRCYADSEYKWATGLTLFVQLLPIVLGFAAFIARSFEFGRRGLLFVAFRKRLDVEKYKIQQLEEWKRDPLPFLIRKERVRRAVYHAKNLGVDLLILFQWIMTFLTRLLIAVGFYSAYIAVGFIRYTIHRFCLLVKGESPSSSEEAPSPSLTDLSGFVLSLEELEVNVRIMIALAWIFYPDRWIRMGKARSPPRLCELVRKSSRPPPPSDEGISSRVQRLRTTSIRRSRAVTSELMEECWSLHLATLMCVIHAAFRGTCSGEGGDDLGPLVRALDEGFLYFTLVDDNSGRCSKKAPQAAKMVRDDLLFRREWLDRPLRDKQTASPFDETIQDLKARADRHVEHENDKEGLPEQLSLRALAADSMSRITGALQLDGGRPWSLEEMEAEAVALVESCLADLPTAIFRECSRGSYGQRENHVRLAAQVLGETQEILKILESRRPCTSMSEDV